MFIDSRLAIVSGMMILCLSGWHCHSAAFKNRYSGHTAEIHQKNGSSVYVDRIKNDHILAAASSEDSTTEFYSLKVTFVDSNYASYNQQQKLSWNKYFNYDMQKDWLLVDEQDTIAPVFFQPMIKRAPSSDDGVLVFEIGKEHHPTTLVYKDHINSQNQIFILKD